MTRAVKEAAAVSNLREFYRHFDGDALRDALRRMYLIRRFEEGAEEAYTRGLIHGTMHLSIGQEASAVGSCMDLRKTDYITSTHRGHGHCIAKGANPALMFAEFFGKEEGYCRGRGGSMHIADVESGNLGANGIVGGGLPIAVGAALAIRKQKRDDVAVCFFGDGASNEGAFHEALNMAAIWKLPVLFICENNKYGMSVSTERSMAVRNVADRASAYNMPGEIVDGNRIEDVSEAVMRATARARNGEGPTLIETKTYRIRGHSKSDRNRYRTREEIEEWKTRDPIGHFEANLETFGILGKDEVEAIRLAAEAEIAAGIEFARNGTDPSPAEVARDVYTGGAS
ncbi:thiamine pyrophosphate-dependent dehydrogenase E1 component subunit alpha [Taklimakanibacter lacteus]|uniref:thiamine pyrophosphate-dependent dehydrogenase E1 component subunit alpha n=1 Tax=Taklimakanibacter lacteus TaxID=2268456 RepID=UPI000E6693F5